MNALNAALTKRYFKSMRCELCVLNTSTTLFCLNEQKKKMGFMWIHLIDKSNTIEGVFLMAEIVFSSYSTNYLSRSQSYPISRKISQAFVRFVWSFYYREKCLPLIFKLPTFFPIQLNAVKGSKNTPALNTSTKLLRWSKTAIAIAEKNQLISFQKKKPLVKY